ncbi:CHAT domain-containing protein [Solwaraspora sp. WMMD791]|uniref:CHAT domain-containing protein n=1 Tax=Solwaraspora sp. WMMD791 TaxID=3016086 RepID=UPI00249BE4B2|nr:CHAT domain-containing protein [Solwaraspora sp. WMMD791]WFE29332.1 CHAT domain-containing protein [Solwaraspora sp. WMMD791]
MLRRRRQPPRPVLLRLQLADALLERAALTRSAGTGAHLDRARDDHHRGVAGLLLAARDAELTVTDLPYLVDLVVRWVDEITPRGELVALLDATIAQIEQHLPQLDRPAHPLTAVETDGIAALEAQLREALFQLSLKRMVTSGADVHLAHAVALSQSMVAAPQPGRSGRQRRDSAALALLARADAATSEADADAAVALLRANLTPAELAGDDPPDEAEIATTTVNLAFALLQRHRVRGDDDTLHEARELIEAALRRAEEHGVRTPELAHAAANAYLVVFDEVSRQRARQLLAEADGESFSAAFALAMLDHYAADPTRRADVARQLESLLTAEPGLPPMLGAHLRRERGRLALLDGEWRAAAGWFADARTAFGDLYDAQALLTSRERVLGFRDDLAVLHGLALARAGDCEAAVGMLEESRARLLNEALELSQVALEQVPTELVDAYRAAAAQVRDLTTADRRTADPLRVEPARAALRQAVAAIRAEPGSGSFLQPSGLTEARQAAADGTPLVYLAAAETTGYALIVHADAVDLVELPELSTDDAKAHALDHLISCHTRSGDWSAQLTRFLGWLGASVLGPVLAALPAVDAVAVVPMGVLGLLPLHAARLADGTHVLDRLTVTYVPNARALVAARHAAGDGPTPGHLLVVDDPQPVAAPLAHAAAEADRVQSHFADTVRFPGPTATRAAVLAALGDRDVLHFACHGAADVADPRSSGVRLADGMLTVADLLRTPLRCRLAVLAACETAMIGLDALDEVVGLPAGLMQAGCAGVVGTGWAVDSAAAALVVSRFYDAWRVDGCAPAEALRVAQRWLRDCTNAQAHDRYPTLRPRPDRSAAAVRLWESARPFADARYWAAFSYVGI